MTVSSRSDRVDNGVRISAVLNRGDAQLAIAAGTRLAMSAMAAILEPGQSLRIELRSAEDRAVSMIDLFVSIIGKGSGERDVAALADMLGGVGGAYAVEKTQVVPLKAAAPPSWFVPRSSTPATRSVGFNNEGGDGGVAIVSGLNVVGLERLTQRIAASNTPAALVVELTPAQLSIGGLNQIAKAHADASGELVGKIESNIGQPVGIRIALHGVEDDLALKTTMAMTYPGFVLAPSEPEPLVIATSIAASIVPLPARTDLAETIASREPTFPAEPWQCGADGVSFGEAQAAGGHRFKPSLTPEEFGQHIQITGCTGVGKSTLMAEMIQCEAKAGRPVCVIDPHGNLVDDLLERLDVDPERIVLIDASDRDHPVPLNPIGADDAMTRSVLIQDLIQTFSALYDPNNQGFVGPRFESLARQSLRAIADSTADQFSMIDASRMFLDEAFRRRVLSGVTDESVLRFWQQEFPKMTRSNEFGDVVSWFASKFDAFKNDLYMRRILETGLNHVRYDDFSDQGKIVLVALRKGTIGALNAKLLGALHLNRLWADVTREGSRNGFSLFVDEAQSFGAGALPRIAAEGRKFGLKMCLSNQFLRQFDAETFEAVTGTIGNSIVFRSNRSDAEALAEKFAPRVSSGSLQRLRKYEAVAALGDRVAFTLSVSEPSEPSEDVDVDAIRASSRERYAIAVADDQEFEANTRSVRLADKRQPMAEPTILQTWIAKREQVRADSELRVERA